MGMCTATIKICFFWTVLSHIPLLSCQMLTKQGCGTTSSCFSVPAGCQSSDDCDYLLKYSADNQNITFELSSNKYEWVAVGFNNKAQMPGGKSLVCEVIGTSVRLNHYKMPRKSLPDLSQDTKATLLSRKREDGVMYCKFTRLLNLGSDRFDLNNLVYFLYAAGPMEGGKLGFHSYFEPSSKLVDLSVATDNSDNSTAQKMLTKQGCGTTSSCFSVPAGCQSSDDCDYLLKYSADNQNITFELSSNKHEWVAVGFNNKAQMPGGKSLVCEVIGTSVRLNHYKMPRKSLPDLSQDTKATLLSGKREGGVMYCKFNRLLNPGSDRFDLNNLVYFLYAAGPMEGGKLGFHSYFEPSSKLVDLSVATDNSDNSIAQKRIDTSSCGKNTSCLRDPKSCVDNRDCGFLISFKKNGSKGVEFSVSGKSEGWISIGFNSKAQMGGTDAVICQRNSNQTSLWTAELEYSSPSLETSNEVKLMEGKFEGGIIYCRFTRPLKPNSNSLLDISASKYIIFAKGAGVSSRISKHVGKGANGCSDKKVDFSSDINYLLGDCHGGELSKVHGSFMIFSWMFLAVVSVFIARYSRSLWGDLKIFGKDAWFQFHRLIMGFAVLLTIISIIIIFVHKEGWSESAGDHAVFGVIVLALAVIQPTVALFRPHPGSPRRLYFNWFHRIIALAVFIMAVLSVFKGADLVEDDGGDIASKILIVLLVIALTAALILEFLAFRVRSKSAEYMPDSSKGQMEAEETRSLSFWEMKVQRVLLAVLFGAVFVLSLVMILYVAGVGGDDDDHDH